MMKSKLTDWLLLLMFFATMVLTAFSLISSDVYSGVLLFCAGYVFRDNFKRVE